MKAVVGLATAIVAVLLTTSCTTYEAPEPTSTAAGGATASPTTSPPASGAAIPPSSSQLDDLSLAWVAVGSGYDAPVLALAAPDGRTLIVEQAGRVRTLEADAADAQPWLDLTDRVTSGGERGLLGLAFTLDGSRVVAHYSGRGGATTVEVFPISDGRPTVAHGTVLLTVDQPAANHNGGMIAFAPDGTLYIALGDGGGGGDTYDTAHNPHDLLGTILRLDIDTPEPPLAYGIPADNPFADGRRGAPEVWAFGLRNPWRFTIDDDTIYIGDVGQSTTEEIDAVPLKPVGYDFGWSVKEGSACFSGSRYPCDDTGLTDPVVEFPTANGACSVIAGVVYRGPALPALKGHLLYSDYCAGFLRSFRLDGGTATDLRDWTSQVGAREGLTSLGTDPDGEVLATTADGTILRLAAG